LKLKEKKKYIVASLGNIAASGGYYVALPADVIVANRGTLTGSIGVIGNLFTAEKLFEKLAIHQDVIKTGEYMDMGSLHRSLTDKERQMLQSYQKQVYEDFKLIVAKERDINIDDVEKIAQGKIFSGEKAKELNMVDELGSFFDALDLAKKGAGIKGRAKFIRMIETQEYGWLVARSRFFAKLGLDNLNLNNLKQKSFAEFKSYVY
jgi:protease-4